MVKHAGKNSQISMLQGSREILIDRQSHGIARPQRVPESKNGGNIKGCEKKTTWHIPDNNALQKTCMEWKKARPIGLSLVKNMKRPGSLKVAKHANERRNDKGKQESRDRFMEA
jgi:hypothetical protein